MTIKISSDWLKYGESLLSLGLVIIMGSILWLSARRDATLFLVEQGKGDPNAMGREKVLRWLPRILAILPLIAMAYGLQNSKAENLSGLEKLTQEVSEWESERDGVPPFFRKAVAARSSGDLSKFNDVLDSFSYYVLAAAVVSFLVICLLDRSTLSNIFLKKQLWTRSPMLYIFLLANVFLIGLLVAYPVSLPQSIGAVGLLCIFIILLNLWLVYLQSWSKVYGIPFLLLLILLAIVFAAFDLNDNHEIRTVERKNKLATQSLSEAFGRWWDSRQDRERFESKRYPIYIVSAQGGGIYAAYHVANFLSSIQDRCPGFGHHLFAISGVSGGSVGAAVFASFTREIDWDKHPYWGKGPARHIGCHGRGDPSSSAFLEATTEVFRADLLSPLLGGLLFTDFVQRFLFVPVQPFDRARAIEYALEKAYSDAVTKNKFFLPPRGGTNGLAGSFLNLWQPEKFSHTPALLINTTEVATGRRRIVAPFTFNEKLLHFLPLATRKSDPWKGTTLRDLPISTAALLSARFPWLSPAGFFWEEGEEGVEKRRKVRVVDGGYFENSGVATTVDLANAVFQAASDKNVLEKIQVRVIVFTSAGFAPRDSEGFNETMAPLRAMLNTREARGHIEIEKAEEQFKRIRTPSDNILFRLVKLELAGFHYPLPLGWRLSPTTRGIIDYQNGKFQRCLPEGADGKENEKGLMTASCVKESIFKDLH